MSQQLQQFEGVGVPLAFSAGPIIILSGDIATLKTYLGDGADYSLVSQVSITVGPLADKTINLPSMAGLLAARAFAEKINGREYGSELTREEEVEAKAAGLVVVFGGSDDLAEFRGAIRDEAGIGTIRILPDGSFLSDEDLESMRDLVDRRILTRDDLPKLGIIKASYGDFHSYETKIPCACFIVNEGGEKFCEGIVFHINDLTA